VLAEAAQEGDLPLDDDAAKAGFVVPPGRWGSLSVEHLHALHQLPKEKE
jgi:hypothetical protein